MGKASRLKKERSTASLPIATHEPDVPFNWPHGHVGVSITDLDEDECIEVTVHDVKHYLHATTARELNNMLSARLDEWNEYARAHGAEGV